MGELGTVGTLAISIYLKLTVRRRSVGAQFPILIQRIWSDLIEFLFSTVIQFLTATQKIGLQSNFTNRPSDVYEINGWISIGISISNRDLTVTAAETLQSDVQYPTVNRSQIGWNEVANFAPNDRRFTVGLKWINLNPPKIRRKWDIRSRTNPTSNDHVVREGNTIILT